VDSWEEFMTRFGGSQYRAVLANGLGKAIELLRAVGCSMVYVDGSFITSKELPGDFDACWRTDGIDWARLDPIFRDFSNGRAAQKARFYGEFFPASLPEGVTGLTFLEFFQQDKDTGEPKGIVAIELRREP
jgi:hypothetical protein